MALGGGAVGDWAPQILRGEGLILSHAGSGSAVVLGANRDGEPEMTFSRVLDGKTYSMSIRMYVAEDETPVLIFVDQSGTRRYKVPR